MKVQDDGVTEDGCAFLVLDLLEGDTIEARRMRQGGSLPIDEVLEIADQALDALAAAHEKGIVHRDLKPDNVFLCTDGRVKLLDFGLARMKDLQSHGAETTKTGVTIGTPEFMPPEQAQGRRDEVDARSDVWGLGATLFTAITGKYVHDANTLHEQLVASATIRPRAIRELAPHVPAAVAVVIDRALELEKAIAGRARGRCSERFVPLARRGPTRTSSWPRASRCPRHRCAEGGPRRPRRSRLRRPCRTAALPVSSSGRHPAARERPASDKTIQDAAPRTPQMLVERAAVDRPGDAAAAYRANHGHAHSRAPLSSAGTEPERSRVRQDARVAGGRDARERAGVRPRSRARGKRTVRRHQQRRPDAGPRPTWQRLAPPAAPERELLRRIAPSSARSRPRRSPSAARRAPS